MHYVKVKITLAVAIALGVCAASQAETVMGSIRHAEKVNPAYLAAKYQMMSQQANANMQLAAMLPSINLSAGRGRQGVDNNTTRQLGFDTRYASVYQTSATVSQMLFDLPLFANYEQSKANHLASMFAYQGEFNTISVSIINNYLDMLRYRRLLGFAEKLFANDKKLLRYSTKKFAAGVERKSAFSLMKKQVSQDKATITELQNNLQQSENNYQQYTQIDSLSLSPISLPKDFMPRTLHEATKDMLANNLNLKQDQASVKAARLGYSSAKSNLLPTIALSASAIHQKNFGGVVGDDNEKTIELTANFNVFNGGSDSANITKQYANYMSQLSSYQSQKLQLINQLQNYWSEYQHDFSRIRLLKLQEQGANVTAVAYYKEFSVNRRTLLDLVQMENMKYAAEVAVVNAENLQIASAYQILAMTNELKTLVYAMK